MNTTAKGDPGCHSGLPRQQASSSGLPSPYFAGGKAAPKVSLIMGFQEQTLPRKFAPSPIKPI